MIKKTEYMYCKYLSYQNLMLTYTCTQMTLLHTEHNHYKNESEIGKGPLTICIGKSMSLTPSLLRKMDTALAETSF